MGLMAPMSWSFSKEDILKAITFPAYPPCRRHIKRTRVLKICLMQEQKGNHGFDGFGVLELQ